MNTEQLDFDSDSELIEHFEVGEDVEPKSFKVSKEWDFLEWARRRWLRERARLLIENNKRVLTDTFATYINNTLPIYLLRLHDMKLVSRPRIIRSLRPYIDRRAESSPLPDDIVDLPSKVLRYAILSHRWDDHGELDFIDILEMSKLYVNGVEGTSILDRLVSHLEEIPEQLGGKFSRRATSLKKLVKFCDMAQQQNCQYAWIDACCIDKRSSSELEESIRSMFRWYRNSTICIVHLSSTDSFSSLSSDPWFSRGWTLQELLAPKRIKFFDNSWSPMLPFFNDKHFREDGHNSNWLLKNISNITSIPVDDLQKFTPGTRNIRQTMKWMSQRRTTRIEDMAYCLLGIFDINLSISYGEGAKAFYRLQVELLQTSNDRGIFLWSGTPSPWNSMLAATPKDFSSNESPHPIDAYLGSSQLDPTSTMTSHGLRIPQSIYNIHRQYKKLQQPYFYLDVDSRDVIPIDLPSHIDYIPETLKCAILGKVHTRGITGGGDTVANDGDFFCIFLSLIPDTSPPQYKRLPGLATRVKISKAALKPAQVVFIVADDY